MRVPYENTDTKATKLIATFMFGDLKTDSNGVESFEFIPIGQWKVKEIYYNSSWDWLMPVVSQCMNLAEFSGGVLPELSNFKKNLTEAVMTSDIKRSYSLVIGFIKLYNKK